MMQVQSRMNQITQMNQMVTSMMAAMHQMQMSIIQNLRVLTINAARDRRDRGRGNSPAVVAWKVP